MIDACAKGPIASYLRDAIETFDRDPPTSDFQRGYLAALQVVEKEAFAGPLLRDLGVDLRALIKPGGPDRVRLPSGEWLEGEGATAYIDLLRAVAELLERWAG